VQRQIFQQWCGLKIGVTRRAEEFAEKVGSRDPALKGGCDFEGRAVSLKGYPDTKQDSPPRQVKLEFAVTIGCEVIP
jgi:hypothetical protein